MTLLNLDKMRKKIYVRLGVSDIVLTKKENERFNGYVDAIDENGDEIANVQTYLIGYEDEDGNECNKEGDLL